MNRFSNPRERAKSTISLYSGAVTRRPNSGWERTFGTGVYCDMTNAAATPSFREDTWIFSVEGVWQATPQLQLAGKYAGKIARSDDFSAYTDLVSARFLYDLTDRWDIGAEYRILTSHKVNTTLQGGAAEVGYRIVKNLWVAVGYSFDKFDADLACDSYQGEGPYLKLRVKFDENTLRGFRSTPPSGTTATTVGR